MYFLQNNENDNTVTDKPTSGAPPPPCTNRLQEEPIHYKSSHLHRSHDIESAFQRNKYVLVLTDLTAAYNTVWHHGLYLKLLRILPDVNLVRFMMAMIQNKSLYVGTLSGNHNRKRKFRNGLLQGSLLTPIFLTYTDSGLPTDHLEAVPVGGRLRH